MPRYVVVESRSGKPYGDTARHGAEGAAVTGPTEAAFLIDRAKGRSPRSFGMVRQGSPSAALDVYRIADDAPLPGGEPDDIETMDAVARYGVFETSLVTYNS